MKVNNFDIWKFLYLELLQELAPVLRAVAAPLRTAAAVHRGQLVVQDEPADNK